MPQLLKEPFIQFTLIGAALFGLDALAGGEPAPQPASRDGAPARTLNDALYLEALARGLAKDDPILYARLVTRARETLEAEMEIPEPSDETLEAWLEAHAARYRRPNRINFEHRFFDAGRGGWLSATIRALDALEDPEGAEDDVFPLGRRVRNRVEAEVDHHFGAGFSQQLAVLPQRLWLGPIEGAGGLHLIRRGPDKPGGVPPLAQIRAQLRADWRLEQRRAAWAKLEAALLARHGGPSE